MPYGPSASIARTFSFLLIAGSVRVAQAQEPTSTASSELPDIVKAALAKVSDFSFSYDGDGLIALLSHLKASGKSPGYVREPVAVARWADLLEHPADFRGVPVTVTGVVGRNSAWRFQQPEHQALGAVHELQISRDDQPIICKLVFTQDVGDVAVGASVTATGYFLTIQQFYGESNRLHQAAVLVGLGPTQVTHTAARPESSMNSTQILGVLGALTLGLIVAWFLLRKAATRPA